jgi:hypothetical protein
MSVTTSFHEVDNSLVGIFPPPNEFLVIKLIDKKLNEINIYLGKDPKSLIFLDKLRHNVDQAIEWARG